MPSFVTYPKINYTVIKKLGEGSYGDVSLVTLSDNQMYAMKRVKRTERVWYKDINMEYTIQRYLTEDGGHPNLTTIHKRSDLRDGALFFMDYVEGGCLFDRIPEYGFSLRTCHRLFQQLISGLSYMHENGVVHMDIKPENLLVSSGGTLKIADFGSASFFRDECDDEEMVKGHKGTRSYAAPEVLTEDRVEGPPADIWSSGIVLFFMATGNQPWTEANRLKDKEYEKWILAKWKKCQNGVELEPRIYDLIRRILRADFTERAKLEDIKSHEWFITFPEEDSDDSDDDDTDTESDATECSTVDDVKESESSSQNSKGKKRENKDYVEEKEEDSNVKKRKVEESDD
ncbi:hypothetical protein GCK72_003371 [Caenorhabditis remanei]|uniref:Protein kinase domain-containing protein n=1 Tax=Caenorhabditis remanei TaxID=31234 RepID=A0A6A5HX80_CAERE|nr:hypothetical protein GCK72_003371 [Caenorhabditis remanei]KAF1771544.1 hypothetical protein GCK72_003371 [Caenorhabditis remanei]